LIPLKDNIPTSRFATLTLLLIVANVAVFIWQLTFPDDQYASPELQALGVPERDENALEYGAIPYRILNPGTECAAGAVPRNQGAPRAEIICEGTRSYDEAKALSRAPDADQAQICGSEGCPLVPLDGPPWWATVLTSMFMHGGILHLAGNMLFLWVFGNNIEDSMGRARFLLFYVLAGAVAVYAQALLEPGSTVPTIGASGAVAGVLGGYILLHPRARVLTMVIVIFFVTFIEIPAVIMLGIWFVLQALPVVGQLAVPEIAGDAGIAYLAHVGGFIFGLATIKLWANRHRAGESGTSPAW
jgi:membrane associated rhomboid family serine protease